MRFFTFLLLFIFSCSAVAQQSKINFDLQVAIKKYSSTNEVITLFVKGNVAEIKKEVLRLNGKTGLSAKGFIKVELPANYINEFSKNNFVDYIEYTTPNLQVLNDTALIQNNVIPAHSGTSPLIQPYTGKGVLFGLIDTGIDLTHPDFQDSLGNTRILRLWDQAKPFDGNSIGYGAIWDSAAINLGISSHYDSFVFKGHGSHVTGIAAGNGRAVNNYKGVAPDANIIVVSVDFNSSTALISDAVNYIYSIADSLGMPCVINVSLGDYRGSHDGTDAEAVLIDSLVNAKPGRAFVCAAGNAGALPFHLQHNINSDTTFTWFKYNPASILGYGAVFYEIWADTADLNTVDFAIGMNLPSGSFDFRGRTPFDNIQNRLGTVTDTIKNGSNTLAIVDTYGELQGDKYLLQVHIQEPDSSSYLFSLLTTGNGKLDIWSTNNGILRTSEIVRTALPSAAIYPNIVYYQLPDTAQTIVSSFTCLPTVIAVGTYHNRKTYLDVDLTTQVTAGTPGQIDVGSSIGPNRRGVLKPEIAATGRYMMSSVPDSTINFFMANPVNHMWIAPSGKHMLKNGTSMASPVVAGIAALYFEKCPTATMAEIKNAITTSAKKDSFTGTTANTSFGNGKADGFNTLNSSNFNFTLGNDAIICEGDSLLITAPSFSSYLWFNVDTNSTITIDTTASIYLSATNQSGCLGFSDTLLTTWKEKPNKPIINQINNDTLTITSNVSMQWYLNNTQIVGATDTVHVAQTSGNYFVMVTDSFGCVNYSDTITVTITSVDDLEEKFLSVYPNPTSTNISIELSQKGNYSYIISNVLGKVLDSQILSYKEQPIQINMRQFKNGIYFITLIEHFSERKKTFKIIKN